MLSKEDILLPPALPEAIISGLSRVRATRFGAGVVPCPGIKCLGAIRAPSARTVSGALRVMGCATDRHVTTDHRVLNRATWSARHASRLLLGWLIMGVAAPRGDDCPRGRRHRGTPQRTEDYRYRGLSRGGTVQQEPCQPLLRPAGGRDDAVEPGAVGAAGVGVARSFGLVLAGWRRAARRRHQTSVDWVRQMMQQVRHWLPGRRLVLVVDGGFAAELPGPGLCQTPRGHGLAPAWGCGALSPATATSPPAGGGANPLKGTRQQRLQGWAERADTPWEPVAVDWDGGPSGKSWGCSPAPPCGLHPGGFSLWRFAVSS